MVWSDVIVLCTVWVVEVDSARVPTHRSESMK